MDPFVEAIHCKSIAQDAHLPLENVLISSLVASERRRLTNNLARQPDCDRWTAWEGLSCQS